ncbi:hypothetical protein [uncultured Algibacter sp.]|uniref:hypothetical protein n=1 Tax=uncultured Algibacter sp. TaxID=298659 RepID=UPI002631654F|nr:hypothetical protein [uncultured Algibacter sp.]
MRINLHFTITFTLLVIYNISYGQDHHEDEHHNFKHFRIAALLGHAFSPEAKTETSSFLLIPTLGLDIQYWFNHKWGLALKNDIEFAEYLVENKSENSGPLIERSYPFILALPVLFSPWDRTHFTFILGPGIEFSPQKNFVVFRVGAGSEFELGNHWDFSPELIYDLKDGHINVLTFALGVGKRF